MSFAFLPRSLVTMTSGFEDGEGEEEEEAEEAGSLKEDTRSLLFWEGTRGLTMAGEEERKTEAMTRKVGDLECQRSLVMKLW
ncbi:hypothetical protein B296_00024832 [Ensete ventricosum]|uniref:Uncharacterized protein n=1 Tax=Ensete ventricosum TaxID=4639 RepID=A0A427A4R1_ENSVE|nr:hypothetical protein B296_00024832 [Ensete ventricosum]